jgi:pSer/pThr/pTyr-binding forkhead associated (FHA) protein
MIWIEILSRQRDVAARFRIAGAEAHIGRGYHNDVIIDDPYVAASHLRVFRDEAGQLAAEDMGSVNGTYLDGSRSRSARIVINGKDTIRIGQTSIRVRDVSHEVERERVSPPDRHVLPIVLAVVFGAALLGFYALKVWLTQTGEPRASNYVTPILTILGTILVWAGIWALVSRIFSGRSRFLHNLFIALVCAAALLLYVELAKVAAFAWTLPSIGAYEYVAIWSIIAAACFFHLRAIGHTRLWLKGTIVAMLLAAMIAVLALQQSEAFSDSGRRQATRQLMPPSLRAVPLRDENAFFVDIARLKAKLDGDRAKPAPAPGEPSQ